jgi:hypothetical protein
MSFKNRACDVTGVRGGGAPDARIAEGALSRMRAHRNRQERNSSARMQTDKQALVLPNARARDRW